MTALFPWLWLSGVLWVALGLWLYLFSPYKGNVLCKALTTAGPVLLALLGAWQQSSLQSRVLLLSLCLFLAADVCIDFSLLPGVLVFLLGHVGLIAGCLLSGSGWQALLFPGVLGCLALAWAYRRRLKTMGALAAALLVYVFVLFGMVGSLMGLLCRGFTNARLLAGLGALLFLASDLLLGDTIVTGRKSHAKDVWVMCLYETALLCLVLAPFAP